jgi:hypothetical protein
MSGVVDRITGADHERGGRLDMAIDVATADAVNRRH